MAEVEIKAKITNSETVIAKLAALGCQLSDPIEQNDKNYIRAGLQYQNVNRDCTPVIRLRKQKDKIILTVKYNRYPDKQMDMVEIEVHVSDAQVMDEMLRIMGFYEVMQINKSRRKAKYKDYEICLDDVEGLGSFIEIEKITEQDGNEVEIELLQVLNELGVNPNNRVYDGYDFMILNSSSLPVNQD